MRKLLLAFLLWAAGVAPGFGATLTVTNGNDSGTGSLRETIGMASAGDTIVFDLVPAGPIRLTSGALLIQKMLTIAGPGATSLTIERDSATPDFFDVVEVDEGAVATLSGVTIANGEGAEAGGIVNRGTLVLASDAVSGNDAGNFGACAGGICNYGNLTITQSTISGNTSAYGPPGIASTAGTVTMTNCTISGNRGGLDFSAPDVLIDPPTSGGGGLLVSRGTVVVTNCTITDNVVEAASGDGICVSGGTLQIKNTLVAGNGAQDVAGEITSLGHNLIGNGDAATFAPKTGDQIGTATAPIDPKLGPLQNNGGTTETHALLAGSPAIDKGASTDGVTTDQRGRFRPVDALAIPPAEAGDNSDIGAFEKQAAQPLNISTRAEVLTGENVLDAGFIIGGTEAKQVLIRGLGPSLGEQMLSGLLADPVLELHDASGAILLQNDDWKDDQQAEIEATGIPPQAYAEAALVTTLQPGEYTVVLSGKSGGTGVGLVELYDLNEEAIASFANLSTRGYVGTGNDVMIAGFILGSGGGLMDQVIVRALGPSLDAAGVTGNLADPTLELHDENGALIASNDDWQDTQEKEIMATGLAPTEPREAAILQGLPAGTYTAIVRGTGQTTGVALLEVYDLH